MPRCGRAYVSRALGALTASLQGLGDAEMEDLMTLDPAAMATFDPCLCPRRAPPAAWLRVSGGELGPFLLRVHCEGVTVHNWAHGAFVRAATRRYLRDEGAWGAMHSLIADYWLGAACNESSGRLTSTALMHSTLMADFNCTSFANSCGEQF